MREHHQMQKEMRGVSILHRLLLYLTFFSLSIILMSGIINYNYMSQMVKKSVTKDLKERQYISKHHFQEILNRIAGDLKNLESSAYINQLLVSRKDEIYLSRPDVEKQFVKLGRTDDKYISIRFIDIKGREQVIIREGKRIKSYSSIDKSYFPRIENAIFSDFNLTANPTSNICPLQYLADSI